MADLKVRNVPAEIEGKMLAERAMTDLSAKLSMTYNLKSTPADEKARIVKMDESIRAIQMPIVRELADYQSDIKTDRLVTKTINSDYIMDHLENDYLTPNGIDRTELIAYKNDLRKPSYVAAYELIPDQFKAKYQNYLGTAVTPIAPPGGIFSLSTFAGQASRQPAYPARPYFTRPAFTRPCMRHAMHYY